MEGSNMKLYKKMTAITLMVTILVVLFATGCTTSEKKSGSSEPLSQSNFQLDTVVTISLYDWKDEATFQQVFAEIDRLEKLLSVDYEGSDLDLLSKNAGKTWTTVSPETWEVIKTSVAYSDLSGGSFDITAGPLISLWNIKDGKGHYPNAQELEHAKQLIDYEEILFQNENQIMLKQVGMKANLGSIAKGYIADCIKEFLVEKGVKSAIINLGGNVVVLGGPPNGGEFNVGIQDPLKATGETLGMLQIKDKSLVSSGIYERYFEYEGKHYHHILDPNTGFPSDNGLAGVTIVSGKSVDGDALSTTTFLLGKEKGMELIESIPDTEAIFITTDGAISVTSGLEGKLIQN